MMNSKSIEQKVAECRRQFKSGITRDKEWRRKQLMGIRRFIMQEEEAIFEAQYADMKQPKYELKIHAIASNMNEVNFALNNLDKWMKPKYVSKSLVTLFDKGYTLPEPYGVVVIFSSWNYPMNLIMQPLIGAISAGNTVLIKPSEQAPHTSSMFAKLLPKYIDKRCFQIVEGGEVESTELLTYQLDMIMYTGNPVVGRIVMAAAAKYLTPCILELGGKCPAYVCDDADLEVTARRICWGKYLKAGQMCIDVDYILCSRATKEKLVPILRKVILEYYGVKPTEHEKISRIINKRHFNRLVDMLKGTTVVVGDINEIDAEDLYIPPMVLDEVPDDHPLTTNEVFGPLLYFRCVENVQAAIDYVNAGEKPLALYVFTSSDRVCERFVLETSSGGVTCNDVLIQASVLDLPFGGVGNSGMGSYHGEHTFTAFSHKKSVLQRCRNLETLNYFRIPPYTDKKIAISSYIVISKLKARGFMANLQGKTYAILFGFFVVFVSLMFKK